MTANGAIEFGEIRGGRESATGKVLFCHANNEPLRCAGSWPPGTVGQFAGVGAPGRRAKENGPIKTKSGGAHFEPPDERDAEKEVGVC